MRQFFIIIAVLTLLFGLSGCSVLKYYTNAIAGKHDPSISSEELDKLNQPEKKQCESVCQNGLCTQHCE